MSSLRVVLLRQEIAGLKERLGWAAHASERAASFESEMRADLAVLEAELVEAEREAAG